MKYNNLQNRRQFLKFAAMGAGVCLFPACGGGGGGSSAGPAPIPLAPVIPQTPDSVPSIFWVSQPVNPDEAMLITAGNVDVQSKAELAQLPDGAPGNPQVASVNPSGWTMLPSLSATTRSLTATVPASMTAGIYALRISHGTSKSSVRLVNAPEPWFVQGDQGDTATPGGSFTVAGACLERTGGVAPQAVLVQKGTTTVVASLPLTTRVTTSAGYGLSFSVPANTPEGTYDLWLHNGRGGAAGWVKFSTFIEATLDTVTVKKADVWPATIFNVSAQTGADDDAKFAAAIAAADANGGGKIYVPAGTYTLTKQLVLPNNTLLAGAGRTSTRIKWDVIPPPALNTTAVLVLGKTLAKGSTERATFAIEDLTLEANDSTFIGHVVERSFTQKVGWFARMGINTISTTTASYSLIPTAIFLRRTANTRMEDLLLDSAAALYARDAVSYLRLTKCTFRYNSLNIYVSSQSHNWLVAGNSFEKRGPVPTNASLCFTAVYGARPYVRDLLWTGNTIAKVAGTTEALTSGYTMDCGDGIYLGGISAVNGTTLSLAGTTATTDFVGKSITYEYTGGIVQILDGRGAGQWRYITQATQGSNTIEVDRAWDIEPDGSSTVSLINMQGRVLMTDNDYASDHQHDDYYMTVDSIKAGNKFGVVGSPVSAMNWLGRHYQGTAPGWHLQFLGNQIVRGTSTQFVSAVYNDPAHPYSGIVGAGQVYRNNTNTSTGDFNLRLSSDYGGVSDVLIERNQAKNIILRRVDPKDGHKENTAYTGVVLRANTLSGGASSTVQSLGTIPTGITLVS